MRPTQEQIDRFWSKVDIKGKEECWNWKAGTKNKEGYGGFYLKQINNTIGCHKFAFVVVHNFDFEDIPKDVVVRHSCNNHKCVNPEHLKIGTYKDNSEDMVRSGNSLVGIKNPRYKNLSKDIIDSMRKDYLAKMGTRNISEKYGLKYGYTHSIVKNQIYIDEFYSPPDLDGKIKFSIEIVEQVKQMRKNNISVISISHTLKMSQSQVYNILRGDQRTNG